MVPKILMSFAILLLLTIKGYAQVFVSYHQSNNSFAGVGYEFKRFVPELRVSTNIFVDDVSAELVLPFKVISKDDFYLDAGLGVRHNVFRGLVVPVGIAAFPFQKKAFGFHAELALISDFQSSAILRGSWGITYRFGKRDFILEE